MSSVSSIFRRANAEIVRYGVVFGNEKGILQVSNTV